MEAKRVQKIVNAKESRDGDGVKIFRSIGSRDLVDINPFLLLDELRSDKADDYIGGFPSHPHRGFEAITYMLAGKMRHKDSAGNEGVINAGDLQWMTAGAGIVHSEMPEQTQGRLWGFQFWLNLPASQKMCQPRYQEIRASDVPEIHFHQGKVRVLAGAISCVDNQLSHQKMIQGAITDIATAPTLLDVQLNTGEWTTALPSEQISLVYVYSGELSIEGVAVKEQQLAVLSSGDSVTLHANSQPSGALILSADAIDEPIARSGPFVMNTQAELQQSYSDYRSGKFVRS